MYKIVHWADFWVSPPMGHPLAAILSRKACRAQFTHGAQFRSLGPGLNSEKNITA